MLMHFPACSQGLAPVTHKNSSQDLLLAVPEPSPAVLLSPCVSSPSEHSSTSWLQAGPMYPEGHVQMALPLTGLVSQLEPSLQGLLMQASSRWHSKPGQQKVHVKDDGHTSHCGPRPQQGARGHAGQGTRWDRPSPVRPWGHSQ